MERKNSSLNKLEQAWVAANAYDKSTEIAKVGGIVDTENIQTMADWIKDPKNAGFGIDKELAADERLMNKYVIPITVTIPGTTETSQLEIIIDSKYRDVAVMSRDENGAEQSFRIADRITESIEKKAGLLAGQLDENQLDMLKDELESELPKNMKELSEEWTDKERGRGDEELGPQSRKEVVEKAEKITEKDGTGKEISEEKMLTKEEKEKEDEARKNLGDGESDIIETILVSQGLSIADITQVNRVKEAGALEKKAGVEDGKMNKDEDALVIRVRNKSMDGSPDHMIVIQNNSLINTKGKDGEVGDFVDRYGGRQSGDVETFENEAYDTLEFKSDDGTVKKTKIYGNPEPSKQESVEFLRKFEELENEREAKLNEKRAELENETDPDLRNEILKDIEFIQIGYAKEFRDLASLYGVELAEQEQDLDVRVAEAHEDEKNNEDHTAPKEEDEQKVHLTPAEEAMKKRGF